MGSKKHVVTKHGPKLLCPRLLLCHHRRRMQEGQARNTKHWLTGVDGIRTKDRHWQQKTCIFRHLPLVYLGRVLGRRLRAGPTRYWTGQKHPVLLKAVGTMNTPNYLWGILPAGPKGSHFGSILTPTSAPTVNSELLGTTSWKPDGRLAGNPMPDPNCWD